MNRNWIARLALLAMAAMMLASLCAPALAEADTRWADASDEIDKFLDAAFESYLAGDTSAAYDNVSNAYFRVYETTGFERQTMSYISGNRKNAVEMQFSTCKSEVKKDNTDLETKVKVRSALTKLKSMIREDGNKLAALQGGVQSEMKYYRCIWNEGSGDSRNRGRRSGAGENMAQCGAHEGGGHADQENRAHRKGIIERAADGAGEYVPQRDHAEGERLTLGGILGIDVQNDILNHRRRDHGEGEHLQNIGRIEAAYAGGEGNGQRLEHKHRGGKTNGGGAAEAAEQPVIQEHHGDFHDGGETADQAHV